MQSERKICILNIFSAELGDFNPAVHTAAVVSEFRFVPVQTEDMEEEILSAYSQLQGRSPAEAELEYLRYPVATKNAFLKFAPNN
jgi:hypothetical protein